MKKFIMCCPLQGKFDLNETLYKPIENEKLKYKETRFPVIPLINGYVECGEKICLLLIRTKREATERNKCFLEQELDILKKEKNIDVELCEIFTDDSEDIKTQLKLFIDIISKISDGDELYACMTYGTKPTPIIEMMALNYGYRALNNISIGAIVYGLYHHEKDMDYGEIFDITALFYMDEMVNKIAAMGVEDPETLLKEFMGMI